MCQDHADSKNMQYHAVASDHKNVWVVGTSSSGGGGGNSSGGRWRVKLRELDAQNMHGEKVTNDFDFDIEMTTLALAPHHRMLFAGCKDGAIKMMQLPLQGGTQDPVSLAHSREVVRLAVTHDETTLVSVSSDGSVFVFEIKEDNRVVKREPVFAGEILVSRQDLEDRGQLIGQLRQAVEDLTQEMDYQEKRRQVQQTERMRELTTSFDEEAARQSQEFAAVWNSKLDQERTFADKKNEKVEEHTANCTALENAKQKTMKALDEKCTVLRETMDKDKKNFEAELATKDEIIGAMREKADVEFKAKLHEKQEMINKLTGQIQRNAETFAETRRQLELDTDTEIFNVRKKYDEALGKERDRYLKMKGDYAVQKKMCQTLNKEIENKQAETRALDNTKAAVAAQLDELKRRSAALLKEIDEREEQIADKEKKMYRFKRKNQELEKHKFVLDHQIRQLKLQIEPRTKAIKQEKDLITSKDSELAALHRSHLALRGTIEELQEDIDAQKDKIRALQYKLKDFATYKKRVERDIGNLSGSLQDPGALRGDTARLFDEHVTRRRGSKAPPLEALLEGEFESQTQFLSRTVESLHHKVVDDLEAHRGEQAGIMGENVELIREIDKLRATVRTLRMAAHTESLGIDAILASSSSGGAAAAAAADGSFAAGGGARAVASLRSSGRGGAAAAAGTPSPPRQATVAGGGAAASAGGGGSPSSPASAAALQAQALHQEAEYNAAELGRMRAQVGELEAELARMSVAVPAPRVPQPLAA